MLLLLCAAGFAQQPGTLDPAKDPAKLEKVEKAEKDKAEQEEDNGSTEPSRHEIVRQARLGKLSASSLTGTGRCLSSRRMSFGCRPRPDHFFGGSGPVPGAHTEVFGRMPAT